MSEGNTEIIVVLDRSGSMQSCASDTAGGFDAFVEEQRKAPGEAHLTLAQFDDKYDIVHSRVPIAEVPKLDFQPRGCTALFDAIGKTISATKEQIKNQRPGPDAVICLIITDGEENASKEYKKENIKSMIEDAEKSLGWRFVFIGANQDAFKEACGMGISGSSTRNYDVVQTKGMFDSVSRGIGRYRSSVSQVYSSDASVGASIEDSRSKAKETVDSLNAENFFDVDDDASDENGIIS